MAVDEEGTLATLSTYRGVIDGLVAEHQGRVFGSAGDSVIAEFGSAVQAVRCAVAIQRGCIVATPTCRTASGILVVNDKPVR